MMRMRIKQTAPMWNKLWRGWVRPLAVTAAIVLPFKSTFADWNWVPTGSMKPTIMEGDMVWVDKLAYDLKVPFTLKRAASWADPAVGDIVVLFSPEDGTRLVKRVVAGPGDTIEMQGNILILNGTRLAYQMESATPFLAEIHEDPAAIVATESIGGSKHRVMALPGRPALRSFPERVVPPGQYFVMGDSRDNSKDSRFFGFVDRREIVGKVSRTVVSLDTNHRCLPRFKRFFSRLDG